MSHIWKLTIVAVVGVAEMLADERVKCGAAVTLLIVALWSKRAPTSG